MPDTERMMDIDDLKNVLSEVVQSIFGKEVKYRFNVDTFPYTDPSLEVEVFINGVKVADVDVNGKLRLKSTIAEGVTF